MYESILANAFKFELEKVKNKRYIELKAVFLKEPNKHATLKNKFLRPNNNPFMTKDLRNMKTGVNLSPNAVFA